MMTSTFKQTTEALASEEGSSRVLDDLARAILRLGRSNKETQGAGYIVTGYFNALLHEPPAQLGHPFSSYENEINRILSEMRAIARLYVRGGLLGVLPPSTRSEIINVNRAVVDYCDHFLAVLSCLIDDGVLLSTDQAVQVINDISARANEGRDAALRIQNQLNDFSLQLTTHSHQMGNVVDRLGVSAGVVRVQIDSFRRELDMLDVNIEMYEQELAQQEKKQGISATKVMVSAVLLRGVVRRIMRGIAFVRDTREAGAEVRRLRDRLAYLHARRTTVYDSIYRKVAAVASAESYDEHSRIQTKRTRQAVHYMGNMANTWGAQAFALGEISRRTVEGDMGSTLLRINLMRAESSIRSVREEALRIHKDMTGVPFHEEQNRTLSEIYTSGISSTSRTEWEYPNVQMEVIKQSLLEKYGK